VSIQRFYVYAERGLARQRVSLWLYAGRLDIAFNEALLARYQYHAQRKCSQLQAIHHPQLYQTPYTSPQLELWELDDTHWRKVLERPVRRWRRTSGEGQWTEQLPLALALIVVLLSSG